MSVAQSLYEGVKLPQGLTGLITYMRTDSTRISDDARKVAKEVINKNYGEKYYENRFYRTSKDAQDAHEAIRPAHIELAPDDIKGYLTYQFLEGILNDCLFITRYKLLNNHLLNFTEKELLSLVVDIILYCANIVKSNLKYYKTAYYNRKLLIVSQIHAILVSFDSLISNLSPFYKYI